MNGFLLDTNVLSEFSRAGEPNQRVKELVRNAPHESLYADVLTYVSLRIAPFCPVRSPAQFREPQSSKALVQQFTIETYALVEEAQVHRSQIGNSIELCPAFKNRN